MASSASPSPRGPEKIRSRPADIRPASRAAIFVALGLVYVLWGSTYLAIRFAVETLPPFAMAGARFLLAGFLMYGWMRWKGAARPTRAQWRTAWILGVLLLLVGNGAVSWAARAIPSSLAALLATTSPLWMVLLEWRAGARPSLPAMLGVLIGFVGVAVLLGPGLNEAPGSLWFCVAIVAGAFTWALGSYYGQRAPAHESPFMVAAMQLVTGGAALFAVALLRGELAGFDPAQVSASSFAALMYLVIFGSLVGFTAYIWLLKHTPLSLASTHGYVNPMVAVLLGWALAGERLNPQAWMAAPLIIGAVVLITTFTRTGPDEGSTPPAPQASPEASEELALAEAAPAAGNGK